MAAIFALSLVPAGAFAAGTEGDMENHTANVEGSTNAVNQGEITLANTKLGERYEVYRMFELVSFKDNNNATGVHPAVGGDEETAEAYSYAIREFTASTHSDESRNPWWKFLREYGPNGKVAAGGYGSSNYPYAFLSTENIPTGAKPYFIIEDQAISVTPDTATDLYANAAFADGTTYHVIRATENFSNVWDAPNETVNSRGNDGDTAGVDYSSTTSDKDYNAVQDFAQAALAFARKTGAFASGPGAAANYTEIGTGTNATHSPDATAEPGTVVVNKRDNNTLSGGTEHDATGKVPLGYYLVGTTMGSLAALDTTNRTVSIYEKNDEPTVEKKVLAKGKTTGTVSFDYLTDDKDAESKDWHENTDADVNDLVQFRTVVTAQQGARNYVLHDVAEDGLTVLRQTYNEAGAITQHARPAAGTATDGYAQDNNSPWTYAGGNADAYDIKVLLVHGDASSNEIYLVDSMAYTGSETTSATVRNWRLRSASGSDGCDFEIEFLDADATNEAVTEKDNAYDVVFRARKYDGTTHKFAVETASQWVEVKDGDRIVVTYWAQLTQGAFVYDKGGEALLAKADDSDDANKTSVKTNGDTSATPAVAPTAIDAVDGKQITKDRNNDDRNTNSTVLTYGAKSFTKWDDATVTTYQFDLTKTREEGMDDTGTSEYSLLEGAKFKLYKATTTGGTGLASFTPQGGSAYYYDESKPLRFVKGSTTDENYADLNLHYTTPEAYSAKHTFYRFNGDESEVTDTTDEITSEKDKSVHLYGLVGGDYVLVETKAPTGYNKLAHPIVIHVNNDADFDRVEDSGENEGKIDTKFYANDGTSSSAYGKTAANWNSTIEADVNYGPDNGSALYKTSPANGGLQVINKTGQELPSTGGVGTTIFYVAGTVLVVGATVMLVAKRRMGSEA